MTLGQKLAVWAGGSAALMAIGAFGPWAKAFGVISVSGTDGDGVIVLVAALVIGVMVLLRAYRTTRGWVIVVGVLAALVASATSIYDMADIKSTIDDSAFGSVVSIGWGLWLDCIASVSALVALAVLGYRMREEPLAGARPETSSPPPTGTD